MKKSILLIGANDRAMLSMAKQCHSLGYAVDCADYLSFPFQYSNFINQYHILPDYRRNAGKFIEALLKVCTTNKYTGAILIYDEMLELYHKYKSIIDPVVRVICPLSDKQYELSHNKYNLLEYCKQLSFKTPNSILIKSIANIDKVLDIIKFPVIAKPVSTAVLSDNHMVTFNVKKVETAENLIDFIREHINNTPIILQELIRGNGAGVDFIAKNGEIIEKYIHLREREAFGGGVSSLRKVLAGDYLNLFEMVDDFVRSTKWNGLGMMEFKIQDTTPYLMELNARPWGSIEAGVIAGYNIPRMFVQTFHENHPHDSRTSNGKDTLVLNSKLDLQYSISDFQRNKDLSPFFRWLYDVLLNFSIKVEDSLFADFKFNFYNHLSLFTNAARKRFKKHKKSSEIPVISVGELQSKKEIGFVCFGNICRSPFAREYAKQYGAWNFNSYGLLTEPNRLPPISAVLAAQSLGIDIAKHKSQVLTDEACERMEVLLFMDDLTYNKGMDIFRKYKNKMYKISEAEILDPYGSDVNNFKSTYSLIASHIHKLFK